MEYVFWSILLLSGFAMLLVGADWFVKGASSIARRFGVPQMVIGLTVMAFFGSAPEAFVSIGAALAGETDIAVGNIMGTNILNICLTLGVCALLTRLEVSDLTVRMEMPFLIAVAAFLALLGCFQGYLGPLDGVILCGLMVLYFIYLVKTAYRGRTVSESTLLSDTPVIKKKAVPAFAAGLFLLVMGSSLTIEAVGSLARAFDIGERTVALTVVAFGSSFPTLVTSLSAVRQHKTDLLVGNLVGTNLLNLLFVLGVCSLIDYIPYSGSYLTDGLAVLFTSVVLWLCSFRKKELGRVGGVFLFLCLILYYLFLVWRHLFVE